MRVIATDPAVELIEKQGGRLYVWLERGRCCGNGTTVASATDPPAGREFRRAEGTERFEVYLPSTLTRAPDELHVEARRFPLRVEAYWDGCAWVV